MENLDNSESDIKTKQFCQFGFCNSFWNIVLFIGFVFYHVFLARCIAQRAGETRNVFYKNIFFIKNIFPKSDFSDIYSTCCKINFIFLS